MTEEEYKLKLRKYTKEEKELVIKLKEEGKFPKEISEITGIPIGQISFFVYKRKPNKKKKLNEEQLSNRQLASKTRYYRLKFSNWQEWKVQCIGSSLNKRDKSNSDNLGRIKLSELREWIFNIELKCPYCDCELDCDNFSADHIRPVSRGGKNDMNNIQQICKKCNCSKGSMLDSEYRELMSVIEKWEDKGANLKSKLRYSGNIYKKN